MQRCIKVDQLKVSDNMEREIRKKIYGELLDAPSKAHKQLELFSLDAKKTNEDIFIRACEQAAGALHFRHPHAPVGGRVSDLLKFFYRRTKSRHALICAVSDLLCNGDRRAVVLSGAVRLLPAAGSDQTD